MSTSTQDYYETLGIKKTAAPDEIKKAYRRLARKHHPDLNPGDKASEKKFKEINEAYEILSDSKKKSEYDQFGKAAFEGGHGFEGFKTQDHGFGFSGADDIFSDLFSGFRQEHAPPRGTDLVTRLSISLEEAYNGVTKPITLTREVSCKACRGSGAESSSSCSQCKGSGSVKQNRGVFRLSQPCPACGGRGKVISKACKACRGSGSSVSTDTTPAARSGSEAWAAAAFRADLRGTCLSNSA